MRILDGMYNAWVVYWAPKPKTDGYGEVQYEEPVAIRVNWKSGKNRTLEIDGETFTVNHSIASAVPLLTKGVLLRSDLKLKDIDDPTVVLDHHSTATPPRAGVLKGVTEQSDLDDHEDIVYMGMI